MNPTDQLSPLLLTVDAHLSAGKLEAAIRLLQERLEPKPPYYYGWLVLSRLLFERGQTQEAVRIGQFSEQLDSQAQLFQSIQRAMRSQDLLTARTLADNMLGNVPGHPRAIFTVAHIQQTRGDFESAANTLSNGLELHPANLQLRTMQASAFEQSGQYRQAIKAAETTAFIANDFQHLWSLATLLLRLGKNDAALEVCDRIQSSLGGDKGKRCSVATMQAQIYRILGNREASVTAFRQSLTLDSNNAAAWWGLADFKDYRFSDADRRSMERLLNRMEHDSQQRSLAAFALACAEEASGKLDSAMAYYHKANSLHSVRAFDTQGFDAAITRITSTLSATALARQARPKKGAARPIFIVGLPRSGSTLIEQILASHSDIEGTMEQPTLPAIKRRAHLICATQHKGEYLTRLGDLSVADLTRLGQSYLDESQVFRSGAGAFFIDKLPHNFEHVGLIHKILPQAIIIDIRRHPMDCGYSLYKQHFAQGVEFSYQLEAIGGYYNGYLKLMDHWDKVLPGRIHHLQYESLVAHPRISVSSLLDHIGLAFEDNCLHFHKTQRPVRTASSEQVRQPLNSKGIGAWKAVEAELTPLKNALGNETLTRFSAFL